MLNFRHSNIMITHITGQFVDIPNRRTFPAKIKIDAGVIKAIEEVAQADDHYIMPGFIDAHIHICLLYTSPSPRDRG